MPPHGPIVLTANQECKLVLWFKQHEFFYNKKLMNYRDVPKKVLLLKAKAIELNLHVIQLKTWFERMQTRFTEISLTQTSEGPVQSYLTERNAWIYHSFQFLLPHIEPTKIQLKRAKKRVNRAPRPSMASVSVVANDKASQDLNTLPMPSSAPSSTTTPPMPTSAPSSITTPPMPTSAPSSTTTSDGSQIQLLEKQSQQYQQMIDLLNKLVSTLQPQSIHDEQVRHFLCVIGSLCKTMTPAALGSFMAEALQLALDHTPRSANHPPQSQTFMPPQCHYQPGSFNSPTRAQQLQRQIQELQEQPESSKCSTASSL